MANVTTFIVQAWYPEFNKMAEYMNSSEVAVIEVRFSIFKSTIDSVVNRIFHTYSMER